MFKKVLAFLILVGLLFPQSVHAVSITINNCPSSISSEIFNVDVLVNGATNATNYLRVDLYKEGTTNYFGETYNTSDWYGGSDGKSYFPVQIQNSSASATLQAQIGNPSESDYPGSGTYKLKIRRYTSSGSQSQNDIQTPADILITYTPPTPTPTPSPTDTPQPTPTATAGAAPPTATPVKTSTPTPVKTPSPSPVPTPTAQSEVQGVQDAGDSMNLLGDASEAAGTTDSNGPPIIPIILISCGGIFIAGAGLALAKKGKSEYNLGKDENTGQNS